MGTQQLDLGLGGQRELLVKWTGWDTPTWETVVNIDNSQMCKEYFSQYKKLSPTEKHSMRMLAETHMTADDKLDEASGAALVAPVTSRTVHKVPVKHNLAPIPKYELNTERVSENETYVFADILHRHYSEAIAIICAAIGASPDEVLLVWGITTM